MVKLAIAVAAVLFALSPVAAQAAGRCGDHVWCDTNLSPDARAALLLAELTNDEKVSLLGGDDLQGVLGAEGTHTGTSDGIPRVGLPTTYYTDGPVGVRSGQATAMPIPMGLAATFDMKLARLHGLTIATEARAKGNDVVYAPTVNILRTPLWGRAFETFGEDPYLSGRIGVGWIKGAQSTGVIGNVKHYAANNQEGAGAQADESRPGQPVGPPATEGNRLTVNVVVDERALREIYLPQFEMAVKDAKVGSVMCAYPRVNGAYACENGVLLQDILRDDWGFKGYVLADYGAAKTTAPSLNNGLDFDPWPGISYNPANVNAAVTSGQADFERVNEHARAILRTLFAYGFFDRDAYVYDDNQIDKQANLLSAQQIEEAAITLLRNKRKTLPLKADKLQSIALIGRNADEFTTGGGSANVRPFEFQSPRAAIEERAGEGVEVRFDDGSDPERAAALARASDVAVVFAADYQTEFIDRRCLSLQCPPWNGDQDALIEAVADQNDRTIVVLETGGPVLTPWRGKVAAIVEAWYPGSGGGPALARVLFGDVDPGGRLPATFPRSEEDYPYHGDAEAYPGVADQVEYKEGVFVGYRWFDTEGLKPAYPFGFGRSYTKFRYDKLRIRRRGQDAATVSFRVENVGRRTGIEVPQLYLGLPSTRVKQPPAQLKDFRKLTLEPGQRKRVRFRIDPRDISYWNVDADGWRIARGCYQVVIGRSSRHVALIAEESFRGGRCG